MRRLLSLLYAAILVAAFAVPIEANHRDGIWVGVLVSSDLQNPVEQQPWYDSCGMVPDPSRTDCVTNPSIYFNGRRSDGCAWDPDDHLDFLGGPGTLCVYSDWAPHLFYAKGWNATVTITIKRDGHSTEPALVQVTGRTVCIVGVDYDRSSPDLVTVPGSNGGIAVRHRVSVTAVSDGGHGKKNSPGVNFGVGLPVSDKLNNWCGRSDWSSWDRIGTYPGPSVWVMP